jgi:hypothetical protein
MDKVFKCLSKLNHLNVLKIIGYNCESLKAIQNNINELTFKQLEDLKTITHSNSRNYSKLIFIDLIKSLTQLCDRNLKKLVTFETNVDFMEFISKKKLLNGIDFNDYFDFIQKNMRIIHY